MSAILGSPQPKQGWWSNPKSLLLTAIIGAVVFALVAVGAVWALMSRGLTPGSKESGSTQSGSAELKVTGQPPAVTGNWAGGFKTVFEAPPVIREGDFGQSGGAYGWVTHASKDVWILSDHFGDISHIDTAIDPSTGRKLWETSNIHCATQTVDDKLFCLVGVKETDIYETFAALLDPKTGVPTAKLKLAEIAPGSEANPFSSVSVFEDGLTVTLPAFPDQDGPEFGNVGDVTMMKLDRSLTKVLWKSSAPGCQKASKSVLHQTWLDDGVVINHYGAAHDYATGKQLSQPKECIVPLAKGLVAANVEGEGEGEGVKTSTTLQAQGKKPLTVVTITADRQAPLAVVTGQPLPVALYGVEKKAGPTDEYGITSGTWGVAAMTPDGAPAWTSKLRVEYRGNWIPTKAVFDGQRIIVSHDEGLAALDPATGDVLWEVRGREIGAGLDLLGDGTILAGTAQAYDAETGSLLWKAPGQIAVAPSDRGEVLLASDGDDDKGVLRKLAPADRPDQAPQVPADAPACPSGMTPVSFTKYQSGAVLVCAGDQKYVVVMPEQADWKASDLAFVPGGYTVTFTNGNELRASLGGSVVTLTQGGKASMPTVLTSWDRVYGPIPPFVPGDMVACPAGSWPISLSHLGKGWLLVCGAGTASPTSLILSNEGTKHTADKVEYRDGSYCGTTDAGKVCGYHSPAVVSIETSSGTTQLDASTNYFDIYGHGGTGKGTGSYGVKPPDASAQDQVRYLSEILVRSAAGRKSLEGAVSNVRSCQQLGTSVTTFKSVVANREELLRALDSTPVGSLPDGAATIAKLRRALELSLASDHVWVEWAESELATSCAGGQNHPAYKRVQAMNVDVERAKTEFLGVWNSSIAPKYKARTFTLGEI